MLNLNQIRPGWRPAHKRYSSVYNEPSDEELASRGQYRVAPDIVRYLSAIPPRTIAPPSDEETWDEVRYLIMFEYGDFLEGLVGEK